MLSANRGMSRFGKEPPAPAGGAPLLAFKIGFTALHEGHDALNGVLALCYGFEIGKEPSPEQPWFPSTREIRADRSAACTPKGARLEISRAIS